LKKNLKIKKEKLVSKGKQNTIVIKEIKLNFILMEIGLIILKLI